MGAGKRSFEIYDESNQLIGTTDIEEGDVKGLLQDYPNAIEVKSFIIDNNGKKDTANVKLDEVDMFLQDFPDAKPLGAPVVEKKNDKPSTTATPSSSLDIDKELKGKISDKDLYDYKKSRDIGIMGQNYIAELKKKNPAIAEFEAKEAAIKATAPTPQQVKQELAKPKGVDVKSKQTPDASKILKSKYQADDVDFLNKKKREFGQIQKDKEKGQFLANEDFITANPIEGYTEHLRTNYPDKWEDIQTKKVSGEWNRGADVEEEAKTLTEHPFAGPAMVAAMRGKAYFTGETNQADDADFYLQANNWAAKTQQDILGDIEKTDAFKQYKTLNEQLNASPVGAQLKPINEGLEGLSKSKDFLEYKTLAEKGNKQGGKLSEQDYKRYQELTKTKDVAAYIELNKGRDKVLSTPEGQAYAQAAEKVQQLQGAKEIAQYFKTSQGLQRTVENLKAFGAKFPKQYAASQILQNYQKKADSAYKKMPTVVKSGYEMLDAATDAGMNLVGELSSGVLRVAATGYDLIGAESAAKFTNSVASGITNLSQDLTNYYAPSSTQLQLPFFDSYVPYKIEGQSVRLYKNDKGEIVDVRDRDGYSMFLSQDQVSGIDKLYQEDDNKPQEVSDWTKANAPAKVASTVVTLAGIGLVPEAGVGIGLSEKAALFSYGYLTTVNGSYEAIKAQDPLISDDAATLYANTLGLINGGLFLVTPQSLLGKEAVETGYKELGQEYITLLKNGMRPSKAMTWAVTKQYVKHGTEGAMFGVGIELANKGVNAATNQLTGRESVEAEVKLTQLLESGGSMFIASTLMSAFRGGFRSKIMGDAVYTGLRNYEKTLADFENMANKGEITAQDFNRMTNLMSELKPIYDNLADMGEYNVQYKTALISLYAEKYQKQQKLNEMDAGQQGVLSKAMDKVKSVLVKEPLSKRDALVKELNDIDKSIESMAIVNNPDFIVYTAGVEQVAEEKIWTLEEVQSVLKNPKIDAAYKQQIIEQFNKQTEIIGNIVNKMNDPKTSAAEKKKLYEQYKEIFNNTKFYKDEKGNFVPYTQTSLKIGKQYIFDPKTAKFLAIKGAVVEGPKEKKTTTSGEEIVQEPKIIGAQVELPKYFSQGEQFTRDQLQEKLKDPKFLADLKAGRIQVDVFNDIEMESYIENITKEKLQKERKLLQEGPKALGPGEQITPTEPGPAEVLPDLKLSQLGDKEVITEDGTLGTVERAEDGNWYLNLENGQSRQIPVTDNANPSETIKQLGLRLPVEQNVPVAVPQGQKEITGTPIDITVPTGQEVGAVTLNDDGVTFNIPEVGQVTWLKFNYTNKGELKTADVLLPDGKKLKIKDADIVYDMATALSNQTRARLGVTPEVTNGAIEDAVDQIKQTFDKGMTAIYNVVVNAGDAAIFVEKAYEGEPLTKQEQAAALDYLVTAANTINKIDTQNGTEKQNIIDWLSEAYDQVSSAEVAMEGPSELGDVKQGAEGGVATKSEPSTPTKQRIVKHPEITANTQRYLKRIAGDQESIDALTNAIKTAYEEGTSPMEAAKALGYAGQEYVRPLETVIKDMQPEITEKEVKAEAPVEAETPSRYEKEGIDMDAYGKPVEQQKLINAIQEGDLIVRAGTFNGKKLTKEQKRNYERQLARDKQKLRNLQTPREFTADQLEASTPSSPPVKWSATELPRNNPLDIYDAIAQNNPELAPLMQEAIEATKQVLAMMDKVKVEGYPVSGGESVGIKGATYPFPVRLYGQLYNSTKPGRWENASLAIEQFKKELQDTKDFLANPPSEAELAKIKAQREALVLAKQQQTKKGMEEYRQNLEKEKIAADTSQIQLDNIVKELGKLTPEQKKAIKDEAVKDGKVQPFIMKAAIKLFEKENNLPTKTIFTAAPTLEQIADKLGVKPDEVKGLIFDYIKNNNDKVYAEAYLESTDNYENDDFVKAVEKVAGDKGFLYPLTDFKKGDIIVDYAGNQYEVIDPIPNENGYGKIKEVANSFNTKNTIIVDVESKQYRSLTPPTEPTQAELMAKPIAMDVLKVETLFNNNGYDISIDYDNEALITNKKTGEQVEFDQLPENMQRAAEVYGEWVSNIAEMVGDPMEFVAKTRSEYEGELVPYEEVGPEALPQGRAFNFEKDLTQAEVQSVVDDIKENGKPLSEFKKGDVIVWASNSHPTWMQYTEGVIRKVGADYEMERLDGAKEKYPKFTLRNDTLVIPKPEGEPEYKGDGNIRKQPAEAKPEVKTINQLEAENKRTAPKVPAGNVFKNEVFALTKEQRGNADDFIGTEKEKDLPIESISVNDIVPTQKNLTIPNLEKVSEIKEGDNIEDAIIVIKKDDKYYVVDGHHRIANEILKGNTSVEAKVYDEQTQPTEAEAVTEVEVGKPSTDLSSFEQKAIRSHMFISYTPEKRGKQIVEDYQSLLESDVEKLQKKGFSQEQISRYIDGFKSKFGELLSARGATMSSAITGGSKFPVEKNRKALDREQRVYEEFDQWRNKILNRRMAGKITPSTELDKAKSDLANAEKSQQTMKDANVIIRNKSLTDAQKIEKLKAVVNVPEKALGELLKPDYAGRIGFADYSLKNNGANIRRLKERVMELENKVSRGAEGEVTEMKFEGGVVNVDYTKDRVQIMHDEKPSKDVLDKLKSNGWRWSSIDKAWQRKITDSAIRDAKNLTGAVEVKAEEFEALPALEQVENVMTPSEEGKPQYIEGNPVGGTAEVGQYRPEFKNETIQAGKETKIILPDGTEYKAVYVLAPINSVLASHDPNNGFRNTEGYPVDVSGNTTNDRDYQKDSSAQTDVQRIAANPNFDLYLDQGQSVSVGPPVITADGFVVGGSGRQQAMDLLSPSQRKEMGNAINAKVDAFGFSSQGMENLGVFRMLVDYNEPYSKVSSAKFNQSEGKTKSDADTSLTFGTSLNENARAKELLFNTVGAYDTMGDFFNNLAAKRLSKDIMVKNGLVAEKDINKFFDQNGNWTATGKEIFKKGLFATLFDEDVVRLLDTEGNLNFLNKIAKEMPTLATNFKLPADVNLKEEIQEAIRLQTQFQSSGLPDMNTFLRNMPIFEPPSYEGVIMWQLLDKSTVRNNAFRGAIQSYTNSAEQASLPSMFGDVEQVMGKADFMNLILNKVPYEERQIIKNAFADEGFGPRVEEQGGRYTRSMGAPRPKDGLGRYTRFGEESQGSQGQAVGRVEEDQTEYGQKYYAQRGTKGANIRTGYPENSIQHKASLANMNGNGFLPKNISLAEAKQIFKNFPEIRFKQAISGSLFMQMETVNGSLKMFNPFTAKPYDAGRGKIEANPESIIPPTTNPIAQNEVSAIAPADQVLPQAEQDFKNQQLFFDFNDDAQTAQDPGGKYFGFVSAANKIRKMTNLSKNEQEYFTLLNDQVRNQTAAGRKQLNELRDKIGDERATEIQNNVVNELVEQKLGRQLKPGEYATQTSTVTVSKDKYAVGSTQIKTAADVAYIARMIEGEAVENFLLYMLDENGMLSLAHVGTGGRAFVGVDPNVIADYITTFKPKKIWLAHNHPSSTMDKSVADTNLTKKLKTLTDSFGIELGGHVVVDFTLGEYIVLDNQGNILGGVNKQADYQGAQGEVPVFINGKTATFDWSRSNRLKNDQDAMNNIADSVTALRAGENVKGGFLVLNNLNVVTGHFYLTGENDLQDIIKASSALGGTNVITYGNFNSPIYPVGQELPNGTNVLDHLTYQSERFTSAIEEPEPVYDTTAVTMPRAEDLVLPYDRNSSRLQQAVQQAMVDGFLKFDEVMFNLYDGHFGKDVIKMRKALDEVKDAYDNLSFENEDWIDAVSTIKEVAAFNVDNFLKSIQTPQKKTMSLRQQYDDFASWFEYNFPEARPYYKIEFDSELGDAIFTINGEPIQKNGEPISYSRWLNNPSIQKEWHGKDKALVKNQPSMIWVDKDLTPTPEQYITDSSYKLFPFQTHAVNAAIDYFEKGNKGFGLWDGQGVGKTREILAIATEMANRSGKPSLIITKSDNVIDQFKESASAMSLRDIEYKKDKESGVIIGTYQDMVGGKVGKLGSYGTVVFDEAHLLKNLGSQRSKTKEKLMEKMDHVVFATGTPMDKPSQLLYFAKYMSGDKLEGMLRNAGLKASANGVLYAIKNKDGNPLLPEDKGLSDLAIIKKGLLRWRNQMIEDGAMIRREFPFYGTFGALGIDIDKRKIDAIDYILSERPGKAGIMEANRYQEHLKIPYALERVNRALENGKQIVLFCTGVNPTEIKSMGITVPQFASEFSDILTKQGIAHSNIFGDNATQKIEEAKKFQRGETKVAIATITSGGTGIDLDDQVGDAPREVLFVTMPWSADELDQAIRRVSRLNTKSPSVVDFIFANGSYADEHKQAVVYGKMETMRNIQAGMDPDLVEMNKWKEGDELEIDLEDVELIGSEGYVPPPDAVPHSRLPKPTEPYNPKKEKEKAEKEEGGMLGATSGSKSNVGTSAPSTTPSSPTPAKSNVKKGIDWLLGEKRTSIQAKVLQAMIDLGVPTTGEYSLNKKYLGVYEKLPQSIKLRYAQDIFTALHETMHWIDYSVMGGLRYDLKNNASTALLDELEDLYLSLYPGAKEKHKDELKISEGLAVFMQYKLYDPDLARQYPLVEREIFSPRGRFYHPKMTEAYDAFRNILDDIQNMSSAGRVSQRIASETPFDDKFTVSGWNFTMQRMFQNYDESIPLQLWDEAAGDEHTLQASYFMWRNRGKMAANIVQQDTRALSFMSQPMYFAPNGQWVPLKYRMSDVVNNVTKVVKDNYNDIKRIYPEMTTSLDALRTYLIARRIYFMGVKRTDLETKMATIISDAQQDYAELMTFTPGTPEYIDKYLEFNSNHIRPLKLVAEKWKQVNGIIDNEGGSVKELNPNFSASLLAFENPLVHGVISSAVYDNKKGNYISEHDVTEVFNSLHPYMKNAARMYDFINDKVGIDMAVATGLMSRELSNELKYDNALYPGYASFQKHINTTVLDDADFVKLNGGGTSKLKHTMRWKGSEYAIIDPLMSQASMVFEVFRRGMYNNMLLKLAQYSTLNDEFARGFMKLPMHYVPHVNDKGETLYLEPQVKGGEPKGVMVQKLYSNGKVKFYAVNDRALFAFFSSIADEYKMLPFTSHWLGKIGMTSKQLFEKMTTGIYPYWMPINYGVDQVTATINSENGTIPVISSIRYGLPDMIRAAKTGAIKQMQTMSVLNKLFPNRTYTTQQINYVMEYLSLSGSSQTFFAEMERPEVVGALEKMFNAQEGFVNKAKKFFKGSVQTSDSILSLGNDITEVLTRATEYALARKNGKTQEQAMFDAMNITPFAKRGANKLLRIYQLFTPYLKPGMNMSAKQLIEEPRKNPAKTMMIIDAMIGIGALSIFLLWEDLTEDEKNYYRGLDGRTASMYLSVPSKFLGGKEGDIRQFRIPEFVGSFGAMGAMWAIAIMDSKEVDAKQMINAISSNVPSLLNPYDWTMSDKTIPKSVGRNFVANLPPIPKTAAEVFGGKKITYFGTTPIIPRQTESFPTEYQYKLGIGGTSTVAKQISELLNGAASPAEVDLILERQLGRTGKMITDLADNKELKNVFLKTVEDIATNNKFYADFWSRYNDETGEFNVMRNVRYAAKIPKPGEPGYEDWKKEVRQKAETSEIYSSTHFMVMELLKMRDWARLSNNAISIDVYNQMNHLMQGLYENKSNETLMRDVHDAYRALKQEASRIRYESDVDQFNNYNDITKIDKYQIKLKTKKMIKGIK